MLLSVLSYPAGAVAVVLVLLCITLGLIRVCEWLENNPRSARDVFIKLIYACSAFILLTCLVDRLPLSTLLVCMLAQGSHLYLLFSNPAWPFSAPTQPGRRSQALPSWAIKTLAFTLSLLAHIYAVSAFHSNRKDWSDYRRPFHPSQRLPGGRVDWDALDPSKHIKPRTQEAGAKEMLTFLAVGVWAAAVLQFLGICAAQMGLPVAAASRRTG